MGKEERWIVADGETNERTFSDPHIGTYSICQPEEILKRLRRFETRTLPPVLGAVLVRVATRINHAQALHFDVLRPLFYSTRTPGTSFVRRDFKTGFTGLRLVRFRLSSGRRST